MTRINDTVLINQLFNQELLTSTKAGDKPLLTLAEVQKEFAHIELTEDEIASAYLDAYKRKIYKLDIIQKEEDRQRRIEMVKTMWSYRECYEHAINTGMAIGEQRKFDFKLDDDNKGVFELLSLYFSNDPLFEKEEWYGEKLYLNKGICLISPIRGNGKTTLLDCFMYNKRGCFHKVSTKKMATEFQMFGLAQIEKYMWLVPCSNNGGNFFQDEKGFHYDDFGDEDEVLHMGNRFRISSAIVNSIYDFHRDDNQFHRFHISMNYKWSEYEQKFGTNTASRMSEMFNLIKVPGNSRR